MFRPALIISSVALMAALAGCVSLPEGEPPAPRFEIDDITPPPGPQVDFSLSVEDPLASRAIDSMEIAWVADGRRIEYYAGGEWADRAPRLLQRSFQNSGRILAVAGRDDQPSADFFLHTDVRSFSARREDDGLAAVIEIYARLTDLRRRTYAARLFEARAPLRADTAAETARGLNDAAGELFDEIINWALDEGAAEAAGDEDA